MMKRRRRRHEIRKLPPGYAEGAQHSNVAVRGTISRKNYEPQNEIHEDAEMRACKALWKAVLLQQVMDAKSRSGKAEKRHYRHAAEHWLFDDKRDFNMVCELAGLDPASTRRKIATAQLREYVWRGQEPPLTRAERVMQKQMVTRELFDLGMLPLSERPTRKSKRRGFAARGLSDHQMELVF